MAVMMPMGVSVYETNEAAVYVAGMDLGWMSKMFGGKVKEVLRDGAENYERTLAGIGTPEAVGASRQEIGLRIATVGAIAAALVGGLIVLVSKMFTTIMPKMMATMMPKLAEIMEQQGVQPPCARIILERLEAEKG
jgi:hypothetical protein